MSPRYNTRVSLTMDMTLESGTQDEAADRVRRLLPGSAIVGAVHVTPIWDATPRSGVDSLHAWQVQEALSLAPDEARVRWECGVGSDDVAAIVRPVLFGAFAGFNRRRQMLASAIHHPRAADGSWLCAGNWQQGLQVEIPVRWSTLPDPALTYAEEGTMERLRAAMSTTSQHPWLCQTPHAVTASPRIHKGVCERCHRQVADTSVLVAIQWAGRVLTREYSL